MRKLFLLMLMIFVLAVGGTSAQDAGEIVEGDIEVGSYAFFASINGITRNYHYYIPENYNERESSVPLVIVLHGIASSGIAIEEISQFNALADEENFIVAYPAGLRGAWNDGRGDPMLVNIDDVRFIEVIIEDLIKLEPVDVDPQRIYVVGYSLGGFMALRAGCALPDKVAGIGAISASMPIYLTELCNASGGKPTIMIIGDEDPAVPVEGVENGYYSFADTLDFWRRLNICGPEADIIETLDAIEDDNTSVDIAIFPECLFGNAFAFYTVVGGGHTYPGRVFESPVDLGVTSEEIDATQVVWDFLKGFTLDLDAASDDDASGDASDE